MYRGDNTLHYEPVLQWTNSEMITDSYFTTYSRFVCKIHKPVDLYFANS